MTKRELIQKARVERGLSVDELSKISGVPRTTLYTYFKGADMRGSAVEAVESALRLHPVEVPPECTSPQHLRPAEHTQEPQHER